MDNSQHNIDACMWLSARELELLHDVWLVSRPFESGYLSHRTPFIVRGKDDSCWGRSVKRIFAPKMRICRWNSHSPA